MQSKTAAEHVHEEANAANDEDEKDSDDEPELVFLPGSSVAAPEEVSIVSEEAVKLAEGDAAVEMDEQESALAKQAEDEARLEAARREEEDALAKRREEEVAEAAAAARRAEE